MKISLSLITASLLLLSLVPVRAGTIYPRPPCRLYYDTGFTQIPSQCGTDCRFTRANYLCDLREGCRITITQITATARIGDTRE